jgi:hypothetical protein
MERSLEHQPGCSPAAVVPAPQLTSLSWPEQYSPSLLSNTVLVSYTYMERSLEHQPGCNPAAVVPAPQLTSLSWPEQYSPSHPSNQEVTKRCRWLINSALVYEPKSGGEGGSCGVSANEDSCAHGAQINFGDLTPSYVSNVCFT